MMTGQYSVLEALVSWLAIHLTKTLNFRNGGSAPAAVPKVSSPPVPATTVPTGQVNGVHDSTVEDVPAPPTAHAEPNGFDEFDPRGFVPGIVFLFCNQCITRVN